MLPVNPIVGGIRLVKLTDKPFAIGVFKEWCDYVRPISDRDVALITNLTQLSISERVSLLMLKMNRKWITEVRIGSELYINKIEDIGATLDELGLYYGENWYIHSKKGRLEWIQIAASPNLLRYIQKRKSLTTLEAGILYGYPITAVLAFTKIVGKPKYARKTTPAQYYQAGVYSEDNYRKEQRYYESVWKLLKKTAPELIVLAEADFNRRKQ